LTARSTKRDQLGAHVTEVRDHGDVLDHVDQHGERQLVLGAPEDLSGPPERPAGFGGTGRHIDRQAGTGTIQIRHRGP
jgi:hypothetical protein